MAKKATYPWIIGCYRPVGKAKKPIAENVKTMLKAFEHWFARIVLKKWL